ncbi:MAG: type IV secretion system DNA-binding domain-containing protein [Planctomycetia bacterium]|nr:type IV secretion system DNA-binding domain-containing protein [Planctomycetia bacterium]
MTIDLASIAITPEQATRNIMISGLPGSGKTVLVWFLLDSLLKGFPDEDIRILLTDPKKENTPIVAGALPPWAPIWLTHPDEARSVRIAFGKIYKTFSDAERLSHHLIQDEKNSVEKYWRNIARLLLSYEILWYQTKHPGNWTLHDLVTAGTNSAELERKLGRFPPSQSLIQATFQDPEHRGKVVSSLGSYLGQYRALAQNWQKCKDEISLENILSSRCVLMLGHDELYPSQFARLNSLIISELSAAILSKRDQSKRHYLILDEFALLKGFTDIRELLLKGRDSNISVVLTFQDPAAVISVLGKDRFIEITSMCQFKVFLKQGPEASRWASEQCGQREVKEGSAIKQRPIILPDEFMNLSLATGRTIDGFITTPYGAPARFSLPFRKRLISIFQKASGRGFIPRS